MMERLCGAGYQPSCAAMLWLLAAGSRVVMLWVLAVGRLAVSAAKKRSETSKARERRIVMV